MRLNLKNIKEIYFILSIYIVSLCGYPIGMNDALDKSIMKEEKRFPNGTVLGGYNYTDKDGNPIAVKYFADESSYGVEFKSVKISGFAPPNNKNIDRPSSQELFASDVEKHIENRFKEDPPTTTDVAMNLPKKDDSKNNENKNENKTPSLDYEIFSQNLLSSPKKCNNEKVKVYYNTDKNRFARSSEQEADEITKFCELVK